MKRITLLISVMTVLSSVSMYAGQPKDTLVAGEGFCYEGQWPSGEGVLYSYDEGLVFGTFVKGVPEGACICYKTNGEMYWGNYRKGRQTGYGKLYRSRHIVFAGGFRNGRYHGTDTLYREDGSVLIGKFRKGRLTEKLGEEDASATALVKPEYPKMYLEARHEKFLKQLETRWLERNMNILKLSVQPRFQGGDLEDFAIWVRSQIQMPLSNALYQTEGLVIVQFTVTRNGTVEDVCVLQSLHRELDEEVERVVKQSPEWKPGSKQGIAQDVRLTLPVTFW